ncbi:SAM-dependent chlorinase/fluorinase [Dactylosporangium aurantiacum]|uniref:SAM-dependent chlorinase/fluorinase n=1 Tax=Dactylosporangium aurantiacum TaxID=35754 RepID=A0A9Q9INF5_9ACTN|nr:SAM-dependent chlorinase/fluorinase [Dactylosporangium aurantiacum]MDG6104546.1 SAM-dependent chlorinase/fluorinase [Dactylosporangium aurantiacum]UWZ56158.1 SAM-dependent chlorinase/fluorinase [Dactylosporangium aurantiacum]
MDQRWISFTTDYGLDDGFVAACHGVIARLAPEARVIDVTHLVPPGDVRRGAHVLAQTVPSLPRGVHLAVVDPGVGTQRRPIAIEAADGGFLVGPDNGLLVPAAEALGGIRRAVHLTDRAWFAPVVSRTFHGRDIFAPVAARLALGADLASAGSAVADPVRLPPPHLRRLPDGVTAEVLTVDRFGNLQLAAPADTVPGPGAVTVDGRAATAGGTFGDAAPGGLVVFTDSAGYLAVAVNGGSAAALLDTRAGDLVTIRARHDAGGVRY